MEEIIKICSKCNQGKGISKFHKCKKGKYGVNSICASCRSQHIDRNRRKEYAKQYREANLDAVREKKRKYAANTKDKFKDYRKQWEENNKERRAKQHHENYIKNKDKIKERRKLYVRDKYANDVEFRCKRLMQERIRSALKGRANKSKSTMELVGCDAETLRMHIESLFDENMNWDNQGIFWDIDHIVPCASFDLSDPIQQKICFNWSNLQPLEHIANLKKGVKIIEV